MNLLKLIPLIMRLIELAPKIQAALKSGGSIITLLQQFAPDLIALVTDIGKEIFPSMPVAAQADAGALRLDIERVRDIQTKLNARGASPALVVDGQYGTGTKAAVMAFQSAHGLTADGWAGPLTVAELSKPVTPVTPVTPVSAMPAGASTFPSA